MVGARKAVAGAVVLGALLVGVVIGPASSSGLGDTATHEVGHVVFKGQIQGLLLFKPAGKSRTRMYLSLHNLRTNTAYDVIGSTRSCGRSLTNSSRLFGIDVAASEDTDAWKNLVLTGAVSRLQTMKSVRIIGEPRDGSATRSFCFQQIEKS
jgi:hypothetical protein